MSRIQCINGYLHRRLPGAQMAPNLSKHLWWDEDFANVVQHIQGVRLGQMEQWASVADGAGHADELPVARLR